MTIHITFSDMSASENDERFISRRLDFSISRFCRHVRRINVRVSVSPDAPSGFAMRVQMQAMLSQGGSVDVENISNDLHSASAGATDRLARRIERELQNRVTTGSSVRAWERRYQT